MQSSAQPHQRERQTTPTEKLNKEIKKNSEKNMRNTILTTIDEQAKRCNKQKQPASTHTRKRYQIGLTDWLKKDGKIQNNNINNEIPITLCSFFNAVCVYESVCRQHVLAPIQSLFRIVSVNKCNCFFSFSFVWISIMHAAYERMKNVNIKFQKCNTEGICDFLYQIWYFFMVVFYASILFPKMLPFK